MTMDIPDPVGQQPQRVFVLGKRFYTNKDALKERYGRIYQLPLEWSRAGHDVRLWLLDYHSLGYAKTSEGAMEILSTPLPGIQAAAEVQRARRFRPHFVVASGDCYIGLLGWGIARSIGARFVFDVYDKYDEFGAYVRPLGWDLFGFLRRHADFRFYAGLPLAQHFGDTDPRSSSVILNGVDRSLFRPLPRADCIQQLGLEPGVRYIGYFGSLDAGRGINDLVAAAGLLRQHHDDLKLLVCGQPDRDAGLGQSWIVFRGNVRHRDIPVYIGACDVVALPYRRSPLVDMSSSCKIAEYLMCERPIVSTRTPNFIGNFPDQAAALDSMLSEANDPQSLADAIERQLRERIVVTVPLDMSWAHIASLAYDAMAQPGA